MVETTLRPTMHDLINALLLGIIEGITEFLPISSTGHLLIAQYWLGPKSDLFNIAIQAGAILAITLVFKARLLAMAGGWRQWEQRDFLLKILAAFAVRNRRPASALAGLGAAGNRQPSGLGADSWRHRHAGGRARVRTRTGIDNNHLADRGRGWPGSGVGRHIPGYVALGGSDFRRDAAGP